MKASYPDIMNSANRMAEPLESNPRFLCNRQVRSTGGDNDYLAGTHVLGDILAVASKNSRSRIINEFWKFGCDGFRFFWNNAGSECDRVGKKQRLKNLDKLLRGFVFTKHNFRKAFT